MVNMTGNESRARKRLAEAKQSPVGGGCGAWSVIGAVRAHSGYATRSTPEAAKARWSKIAGFQNWDLIKCRGFAYIRLNSLIPAYSRLFPHNQERFFHVYRCFGGRTGAGRGQIPKANTPVSSRCLAKN